MSNQNAGADLKPCPWCRLWNAAFWAASLEWRAYRKELGHMEHFPLAIKWLGHQLLAKLTTRETDCPLCRRSAEIQRGNVLGDQQAAWRAAMWRDNPSMRFMMKAGPGDTFDEVPRE